MTSKRISAGAPDVSRREAMRTGLATAGAALLSGVATRPALAADEPPVPPATSPASGGSVRFVHMTDVHMQAGLGAPDAFAMALDSLGRLDPPPQFIVAGGDHVMDALAAPQADALAQWDLYREVLSKHTSLPVHHLLGNHDIFGWAGAAHGITPQTEGYGKGQAVGKLGMAAPYHSFDAGGWHLVCLDSLQQRDKGFYGQLDAGQRAWLRADLAAAGTARPVAVFSHLPLLAVCVFNDPKRIGPDAWEIGDNYMHRDTLDLLAELAAYNIRFLASGHLHLLDRCEFLGRTFVCDGAVCGNWWRGPRPGCPEGYAVYDLRADGTFDRQYVAYGWKARKT